MTSSACSTLTVLDSASRPPPLALSETARMLSTTLNASLKHAAVADRKRGMLIVRACASKEEMYSDSFHTKRRMERNDGIGSGEASMGRIARYMHVEYETRQYNPTINDTTAYLPHQWQLSLQTQATRPTRVEIL